MVLAFPEGKLVLSLTSKDGVVCDSLRSGWREGGRGGGGERGKGERRMKVGGGDEGWRLKE